MSKVIVEYTATFKTTLHWPDDELEDFNLENLQVNLTPSEDDWNSDCDIKTIKLNGEDHYF